MQNYPMSAEIADQIFKIVNRNLDHQCAHNRENLDDIINDLHHYRESIPTVQEYIDKNLL